VITALAWPGTILTLLVALGFMKNPQLSSYVSIVLISLGAAVIALSYKFKHLVLELNIPSCTPHLDDLHQGNCKDLDIRPRRKTVPAAGLFATISRSD
jgi:hypothetical protein